MAFSTNDVTELFSSAVIDTVNNTITVSGTDLTSINFTTESGVYNVIFGLLDSIAAAVSTGNMQNITVGQSQSLVNADTLRKNYNFVVNLGFDNDVVEGVLDVKDEPTPE